jgi:sugar phosphate permease
LFLRIGLDASYATVMLPTFILAGLGFALAFAPLNLAATSGVAPLEQGLAGGLLNTSFQFGGALVLAVVTAVNNANRGSGGSAEALLSGFHAAIYVSVIVGALGVVAVASGMRRRPAATPEHEPVEPEVEELAA